jgi:catechol 2,3-dioxygenase-like lactoylglutathione lyase family enzyme
MTRIALCKLSVSLSPVNAELMARQFQLVSTFTQLKRRVAKVLSLPFVARALPPEEKIVQVSKDSIDLGIVVTDEKAALGFYRDQLGLEWEGELPVPGGRMYRLKCGTTVIKLLKLNRTPEAKPAAGGIVGGLGYRYFTISVPDIRGLMAQLEAKGITPTVSITEARPGVMIAMVTDPDGNTIEFLQNTGSK